MFSSHIGIFPIHPLWYDFLIGTEQSGNLSLMPNNGEERGAPELICFHTKAQHEDALEYIDPDASVPCQPCMSLRWTSDSTHMRRVN